MAFGKSAGRGTFKLTAVLPSLVRTYKMGHLLWFDMDAAAIPVLWGAGHEMQPSSTPHAAKSDRMCMQERLFQMDVRWRASFEHGCPPEHELEMKKPEAKQKMA
jgi:hypothetical protein